MRGATTFEFILIDEYSMMSVVTAIEPLRVANRILGEERYAWRMVCEPGGTPQASNTLSLPCATLDPGQDDVDYTFVCAGMHTQTRDPGRLYALLNRRHRSGAVGAVSLAPLILARAGLLNGRCAVIHWEGLASFGEEFPDIAVSTGLYLIDGNVMTSCGGLATLDLFLEILRRDHEGWLVQAVANQLQVSRTRTASEQQHIGLFRLPVTAPKSMHKAIALIDQNIAAPLSPEGLADAVGTSRRTLDRQFSDHTGSPVAEFYGARRLEQAKTLLAHSNMPVLQIALATGYNSASHFAASFRKAFDQTPRHFRAQRAPVDPSGGFAPLARAEP